MGIFVTTVTVIIPLRQKEHVFAIIYHYSILASFNHQLCRKEVTAKHLFDNIIIDACLQSINLAVYTLRSILTRHMQM